jgi:hypothetical protein
MDYRLLDRDAARFSDMLRGAREFEGTAFVPDIAKRAGLEAELSALYGRLDGLGRPDPVTDLLSGHIRDYLDGLKMFLGAHFTRPQRHLSQFNQVFSFASRKDIRPDAEKAAVIVRRYAQAGSVWDGLKTWLPEVSGIYLQETTDTCKLFIDTMENEKKRLGVYFPSLTDGQARELMNAIEALQATMRVWIDETRVILADKKIELAVETSEDDCIPFEESYYRSLLHNELGVELDELLSWHEAEIEKTREAVFAIAARLNIPEKCKTMKDVNAVLLKYAGPAPTPDEMFRRGREYIKRTRAAASEYVWLPDEICEIRTVPEQLKVSYP